MGPRLLTLLAVASLGWCAGPAEIDPGGQRIFSRTGYVENSAEEAGHSWIQFEDPELRFRLPESSAAAYWRVIQSANASGFALRVRFDGSAGEVNPDEGYVEYPLCALAEGGGASVGDEAAACPVRTVRARAGDVRLALALAYAPSAPARSRALLDAAIAEGGLAPRLRAVAFKTRGGIAESRADATDFASPAYDRATADALADYRDWAEAAPDEIQAHYAVARALGALGGYREALRLYATILRRWPGEGYDVAILSGGLFRDRGDYARALRQLDDHAARAGVPDGMRFHYHRGWTLTLLRRDREAADEFTQGLTSQPDFAYAFLRRSCARARQGRIADALADAERGLQLLRGERDAPAPWLAEQVKRTETAVTSSRRAAAAAQRTALLAPRENLDGRWESPRARSPLLGAAR